MKINFILKGTTLDSKFDIPFPENKSSVIKIKGDTYTILDIVYDYDKMETNLHLRKV